MGPGVGFVGQTTDVKLGKTCCVRVDIKQGEGIGFPRGQVLSALLGPSQLVRLWPFQGRGKGSLRTEAWVPCRERVGPKPWTGGDEGLAHTSPLLSAPQMCIWTGVTAPWGGRRRCSGAGDEQPTA